jgi:hypothetical protein
MTSQEKAIEIYNKFYGIPLYVLTIKQCCLIVVDEMLNNCYEVMKPFWEEVKIEIEKL